MPRKVLILLVLGLLLRLSLAWLPGYQADVDQFRAWAETGLQRGLTASYGPQTISIVTPPDYLPPYLIILNSLARLHIWLQPTATVWDLTFFLMLKLPGILSDLVLAYLLWYFLEKKSPRWAFPAAIIVLFHPILIITSAGWGQIDSLPVIFLVLMLFALEQKNRLLATLWFTIACLFKLQSVALFPLLLLSWFKQSGDSPRFWPFFIKIFTVVITTVIALTLPFLVTGQWLTLWHVLTSSVGRYNHLSMNAWNFWWLLGSPALPDTTRWFGLPLRLYGLVLYLSALISLVKTIKPFASWQRLWGTAALLSLAFFLFPTEMHERYFFPFIIFAIPLLIQGWRWTCA